MDFRTIIMRLAFCAAMLQLPTSVFAETAAEKVQGEAFEKQSRELYSRFVDFEKDPDLNWECFALAVAQLYQQLGSKVVAAKMRDVSTRKPGISTTASAMKLGLELRSLENHLLPETKKLLLQKGQQALLAALTQRLGNQKKAGQNCPSLDSLTKPTANNHKHVEL